MRKWQKSNYALIAKCTLEISYPTADDWESARRQAMSIFARELLLGTYSGISDNLIKGKKILNDT